MTDRSRRPSGAQRAAWLGVALAGSIACAAAVSRLAPHPSANTDRASEDAFATGLHQREFLGPLMGPGRWTTSFSSYRFRHLPPGKATLEVRVRNHRHPVRVLVGRAPVGFVPNGATSGDFELPAAREAGELEIGLVVQPFAARGGRRLGTFLDRVTLVHERSPWPPASLLAVFVLPAAAVALAAMAIGMSPPVSALAALAVSLAQSSLLWPHGVVRSDYAATVALLLAAGAVTAYVLARWIARRRPELAAWAFTAFLVAFLVQGVLATHPLVIGLDAVFHGHNLADVARGDLFPVSSTQHKPPFRFPYGVTFYALLSPFVWLGGDVVRLVRVGAAVAGVLASAAVFWLASRDPSPPDDAGRAGRRAALSVLLLQLVPWSFEVYSNGNYSNVFGQTATVLFFAWWAGGTPGGWIAGAALLAAGCLGHLSSLIFLGALCVCLLLWNRRSLAENRDRIAAVAVGLAAAAAYYLHFFPLVSEQLPRFLEGGAGARGTLGAIPSLGVQLGRVASQWGVPIIVLAVVGRPRTESGGLARDLQAFWIAGAGLAVAAVVSPLEIRYLYALTLPLSIAAATGVVALERRGGKGRVLAWTLVAAQLAIGARGIVHALLYSWRI